MVHRSANQAIKLIKAGKHPREATATEVGARLTGGDVCRRVHVVGGHDIIKERKVFVDYGILYNLKDVGVKIPVECHQIRIT